MNLRRTTAAAASRGGRPIGSFKPGSHADQVMAYIEQHPDATLSEIVAATEFASGSVSDTVNRLTRTRLVKRTLAPRAKSVRGKRVWSYTATDRAERRK